MIRCVEYLLRNDANPALRDKDGYSAVHYASAYGHRVFLELVSKHTNRRKHTQKSHADAVSCLLWYCSVIDCYGCVLCFADSQWNAIRSGEFRHIQSICPPLPSTGHVLKSKTLWNVPDFIGRVHFLIQIWWCHDLICLWFIKLWMCVFVRLQLMDTHVSDIINYSDIQPPVSPLHLAVSLVCVVLMYNWIDVRSQMCVLQQPWLWRIHYNVLISSKMCLCFDRHITVTTRLLRFWFRLC